MNRNQPVVVHEPVDASSVRYLSGLPVPANARISFESNSVEGNPDRFFRVGDMVEVRHDDDDTAQALAEYIAGCINLRRSITLALAKGTTSLVAGVCPTEGELAQILEEVDTAPEPGAHLDDMLHAAFGFDAPFALPYTSGMDAALGFFRAVLPGYGYMVTHNGSTGGFHRQFYVAKVIRPAKAPDASITDGDSWATHYEAGATTEAMALVVATLKAKVANP